jgi:hypothetical protein
MLADSDYCAWLSQEPGVRALIAAAKSASPEPPTELRTDPATIEALLDELERHGIRWILDRDGELWLIAGKPQLLAALHRRKTRR